MALTIIQIALNILLGAMPVCLIAACFLLVHSVTRMVNLGLAAAFLFGGYGYYLGLQVFGGTFEAFLTATCGLLVLVPINYFLLKPFVEKGLELMGLLASVSLWLIVQELCSLFFGAQGRALVDGVLPTVHFGSLVLPVTGVWTLVVSISLAVLTALLVLKTPLGRALRALKQHSASSAQLGVREHRLQGIVFVVTLLLTGLMGIFAGMNQAVTPMYTLPWIVPAFLAFLVGGGKDVRGVLLAAFLLTFIPSIIVDIPWPGFSISETWREVLAFVLAAGLLVLRPDGLLSIKVRSS